MNLTALFPTWLSSIPLGWIVIAVVFFLLTFDAMRSGPGRAAVIAMASSISMFLYNLLPHTMLLGAFIASSNRTILAALFGLLFVASFVLVYRMSSIFGGSSGGFLFSFIAGISATIALIVTWVQIQPLESLWNLGSQIQAVFGTSFAAFWLIGIYLALAFIRS